MEYLVETKLVMKEYESLGSSFKDDLREDGESRSHTSSAFRASTNEMNSIFKEPKCSSCDRSIQQATKREDMCTDFKELPSGVRLLSHQVAGHSNKKTTNSLPDFLECGDGTILKRAQSRARGQRELAFYQHVFSIVPARVSQLRAHVPKFHGYINLQENADGYIRLDDVTKSYRAACIMDVKIGRQAHDPEADLDKIRRCLTKYPYRQRMGFNLSGMRVFDVETRSFTHKRGEELRVLPPPGVLQALGQYLHKDSKTFHRCIVAHFLAHLYKLRDFFEEQRIFHFYSSSLLFVYEGDLNMAAKACPDCLKLSVNVPSTYENGIRAESNTPGELVPNGFSIPPCDLPRLHGNDVSQRGADSFNAETDHCSSCCDTGKAQPTPLSAYIQDTNTYTTEAHDDTTITPTSDDASKNLHSKTRVSSSKEDIISYKNGDSKVLFDYEKEENEGVNTKCVDMRMIDFTHVFPANDSLDENYLYGLRGLIGFFEELFNQTAYSSC